MARRTHAGSADPILELNRWQATGALLGLGVMVAVVFFAGVVVGRQSASPLPPALARIASPTTYASNGPTSHAARSRAMADVVPGTRGIDTDLSRPLAEVVPRDPTDAARVETHRQLQRSRAAGMAGIEGAPPAPTSGPRTVTIAPSAGVAAEPGGKSGYTLQVSAFEAREPAMAVSSELRDRGHNARLREVSANGRTFWRVEVGLFEAPAPAVAFQRKFERDSGYSTVMISVP